MHYRENYIAYLGLALYCNSRLGDASTMEKGGGCITMSPQSNAVRELLSPSYE